MGNVQDALQTWRRSFISSFLICMTVQFVFNSLGFENCYGKMSDMLQVRIYRNIIKKTMEMRKAMKVLTYVHK